MTLQQLLGRRARCEDNIAMAKKFIEQIDAEIEKQCAARVSQMYAFTGKQSGIVRIDGGDGVEIVADIPKKIEWDSKSLRDVAAGMDWETASDIFSIKFSVGERVYATLSAEMKDKVDAARTVKYGVPKISLVQKA